MKSIKQKHFLLLIIIPVLYLQACFKGDIQPLKPTVTPPPPGSPSMMAEKIIFRGSFLPTAGISIAGVVKILKDSAQLRVQLDSFSVTPGPDLKVYLSAQSTPAGFINLGALQSNTGTQVYPVPASADINQYKYVLIHCQQYNHLFGYAQLK
jgi:hypothetical protein